MKLIKPITYKEFIRRRACAVPHCRDRGPRARFEHHPTKGARGNINHDRGWPICDGHHYELDSIGRVTFQKKYGMNLNLTVDYFQNRYRLLHPRGPELVQVDPWREPAA